MTTTSLAHRIATGIRVEDRAEGTQGLLFHEQAKRIIDEGKPVTVWQMIARLGDGSSQQASSVLEGLTAEGVAARFRAGFNYYYAPPEVALIGKGPTLRTVMADTVRSVFLGCRQRVTGK